MCARRERLVGSAKVSCCLGGSGPDQGWAPAVPFLHLAYLVLHSSEPEPRELKQRPYSPLFRFHLLRLLLLPPATRAIITGSGRPGCPEKKRGGGGNTGFNTRRRRRNRRWRPEEGSGALPPCGRRFCGVRRGQRAAAPRAARSGTDCPILQQGPGPGPGPGPWIKSRPAGLELQGRAAAEVPTAPPAGFSRGTAPCAAPQSPPPRPVHR